MWSQQSGQTFEGSSSHFLPQARIDFVVIMKLYRYVEIEMKAELNVGHDPTKDVILIEGGAPFIPVKAAQWHYEAKKLNFTGVVRSRERVHWRLLLNSNGDKIMHLF